MAFRYLCADRSVKSIQQDLRLLIAVGGATPCASDASDTRQLQRTNTRNWRHLVRLAHCHPATVMRVWGSILNQVLSFKEGVRATDSLEKLWQPPLADEGYIATSHLRPARRLRWWLQKLSEQSIWWTEPGLRILDPDLRWARRTHQDICTLKHGLRMRNLAQLKTSCVQ